MPFGARDDREVLEQQRAEPAALLVVVDGERDLGLVGPDAVVARDRDDLVAELRDERHVLVVVDARHPFELRRGRSRHRREEPQVQRLVAQTLVEAEDDRLVVGADRPDLQRAAVGEDDVALPFRRIGPRRLRCHGTTPG